MCAISPFVFFVCFFLNVTKTKLLLARPVQETTLFPQHFLKRGHVFPVLITTLFKPCTSAFCKLARAGGGLLLISLEFCCPSDKLCINHPGWVIKLNKNCLATLDPIRNLRSSRSTQSIHAVYLQPWFLHQRPDVFGHKVVVFFPFLALSECLSLYHPEIKLRSIIYKGHLCYSALSLMSWRPCGQA